MKKLLLYFGFDDSIAFTTLARVIQVLGAVINLFLISIFLPTVDQGVYYTFGSLIAIQVFFELGLNSIIIQFVAHEVAHLRFVPEIMSFSGEEYYISRLSSLLKLVLNVFLRISLILFIVLNILGYLFFTNYSSKIVGVNWHFPWILISVSTSLMLTIDSIIGYLQGLGFVKDISKIIFFQQIILIITSAIILSIGGGLWTLGVTNLVSVLILIISLIVTNKYKILQNLLQINISAKINYMKEIFPLQWKIALSWISGYFIFQLFNPVLFAVEGPIVAGKMGMTLTALNGISSLSMSWITTKIPIFSGLVAKNKFSELDKLFNLTVKNLLIINLFLLLIFNFSIYIFQIYEISVFDRFLSNKYIFLLSLVTFANQLIFSWATYLRCHKKEPFLLNSIIGACLCCFSTLYFGQHFGLNGVVYGYVTMTLIVGFPWAFITYKKNKTIWHK